MTGNEKLLLAMSEIDEDLILEARVTERLVPSFIKRIAKIAAVIIIVIGSAMIIRLALINNFFGSIGGAGGGAFESAPGQAPEHNGASDGKGEIGAEDEDEVDGEEDEDEEKQ